MNLKKAQLQHLLFSAALRFGASVIAMLTSQNKKRPKSRDKIAYLLTSKTFDSLVIYPRILRQISTV